jgi:serine phosphatase RsbU (regulator of sigma subunit)
MVVDDSKSIVLLIGEMLKNEFNVLTASNGQEAVEMCEKERPDMVLMDVEMPIMNGYEACRRIKSMNTTIFTPIIFITGKKDLTSIKEGLQSGAEDYLTKPFAPEELRARIHAGLRTKRLHTQLAQANAIIERERDVIADIQRSLLCDAPPNIQGLSFFCDYQPSSKAGGDYYDFIRIDEDHLGVLVSDVSGHGTPAAVIMAMTRIVLRTHLSSIISPKEALEKLNAILCENVRTGDFITAFYAVIHLPTRMMTYSSAGHHPSYLINYGAGTTEKLWVDKGFPLMIKAENPMKEVKVELPGNSKIVLFTDGITEARNEQGQIFGDSQLVAILQEHGKHLTADKLGPKIMQLVNNFTHRTSFVDDYTLVIIDVE